MASRERQGESFASALDPAKFGSINCDCWPCPAFLTISCSFCDVGLPSRNQQIGHLVVQRQSAISFRPQYSLRRTVDQLLNNVERPIFFLIFCRAGQSPVSSYVRCLFPTRCFVVFSESLSRKAALAIMRNNSDA
eukprot:6461954-Ditylum_brightwellii.AAC.1